MISIHIQSYIAYSKNRRTALLWNWKAKVWIQCWTRCLKSFLPVLPSCFMTPTVLFIFLVKASSFGLFLICNAEATKWPSVPCPLWKQSPYFRCCVVNFFFVTGMSSYRISTSLAVFNNVTLWKEKEVSHLLGEQGKIQKPTSYQTEQDWFWPHSVKLKCWQDTNSFWFLQLQSVIDLLCVWLESWTNKRLCQVCWLLITSRCCFFFFFVGGGGVFFF